jgi:transposase
MGGNRSKTDFTLRGLRAELAERGVKVDYRTVWSFAHDEGLSFKKKRASRRTAPSQGGKAAQPVEEVSGAA